MAEEKKEVTTEELLEKLKLLALKEKSLESLSNDLGISELEVLGLLSKLKDEKVNISPYVKDEGIAVLNQGDYGVKHLDRYRFNNNDSHEYDFLVISDTRFGSTYQQLTVLNDLYLKAYDRGINNVLLCGNLTEGLYGPSNENHKFLFLKDTFQQINYVVDNYPKIEGMNTYFILGPKDKTHLTNKKIDIGLRIEELRNDMIYLGVNRCHLDIEKVDIIMQNLNFIKTYTVSYRAQQFINAIRSEDKSDILLYGGLLQHDRFTNREIKEISVPSCVATTNEMSSKMRSNTIGGLFLHFTTDKNGHLRDLDVEDSIYYVTLKDDFEKAKSLKIGGIK